MSDPVALVMGGGAGTGRATALAFSAAGAQVAVADINPVGAEQTVELIREQGGDAMLLRCDMADGEAIKAAHQALMEHYGALHWVSNNAALAVPNKPITELSDDEWDRCMNVTQKGVWRCMKQQLPLIQASGGGAIVNIASVSGLRGETFQSAYSSAKGGVITLSKAAAAEYAKRGVRINTVCPGGINTGGMQRYLEKMPAMKEKTLNAHAMGRLAEPEEIANAVVYLCSDKASFITGHDLVVDGGLMIRSNVIDL
jgi:NAD(P)-dependent dehydrogenase (short-subunit alcohol dehydrogenase family)